MQMYEYSKCKKCVAPPPSHTLFLNRFTFNILLPSTKFFLKISNGASMHLALKPQCAKEPALFFVAGMVFTQQGQLACVLSFLLLDLRDFRINSPFYLLKE